VFGCGGDRDATKRPLMGAVPQHHADWVVVTSDNPRSEDPAILHQILQGTIAGETVRVSPIAPPPSPWRWRSRCADVVLIAGKGHEDYQEVAGVRRRSRHGPGAAALPPAEASTWA
jgi:UDP-N-acetylmuramoyl-L-alanyl-D-glutamate--2,6-diaminopimelate ligase